MQTLERTATTRRRDVKALVYQGPGQRACAVVLVVGLAGLAMFIGTCVHFDWI